MNEQSMSSEMKSDDIVSALSAILHNFTTENYKETFEMLESLK